jgi:hypothetical protein
MGCCLCYGRLNGSLSLSSDGGVRLAAERQGLRTFSFILAVRSRSGFKRAM